MLAVSKCFDFHKLRLAASSYFSNGAGDDFCHTLKVVTLFNAARWNAVGVRML